MNRKVYLAGPIAGLSFDEGQDWREYAADALGSFGLQGYSPLRQKHFLRGGAIETSPFTHPLATDKGIMRRDFNDVKTAAVILANYVFLDGRPARTSRGTDMEFAWAYALQIPVVVACAANSVVLDHPMVRAAIDYRVDTLDEALEIVRTICLPDAEPLYRFGDDYEQRR